DESPLPAFEDRLREAIESFERARAAGAQPAPGEWLVRYQDVADRLTAYFVAQGYLPSSSGPAPSHHSGQELSIRSGSSPRPMVSPAEADQPPPEFSLTRYPGIHEGRGPNRPTWALPPYDEERLLPWQLAPGKSGLGLGGALGCLLLVFLIEAFCGFSLG